MTDLDDYEPLDECAARIGRSAASIRRLAARDADAGVDNAPVRRGGRWWYPKKWWPVLVPVGHPRNDGGRNDYHS